MAAVSTPGSYQVHTSPSGEPFIEHKGERIPLGKIRTGDYTVYQNRYTVFLGSQGGMGCRGKNTNFYINCPNLQELTALYRSLVQNTERSMSMPYVDCNATEPTRLESGYFVTHITITLRSPEDREIFNEAFLAPIFPELPVDVDTTSVTLKVVEESAEKANQAVQAIFDRLNEKTSCIFFLPKREAAEPAAPAGAGAPAAAAPAAAAESDPTRNEPIVCGALLKHQTPAYHISSDSLTIGHGYTEERLLRTPSEENVQALRRDVSDLLERRVLPADSMPIIAELKDRMGAFERMTRLDFEIISNLYYSAT